MAVTSLMYSFSLEIRLSPIWTYTNKNKLKVEAMPLNSLLVVLALYGDSELGKI